VTILFVEGFENYAKLTDYAGIWGRTGTPNFLQAGRDPSGSSISLGSSDTLTLDVPTTNPGVLGFGFKHDNTPNTEVEIFRLDETGAGSSGHVSLNLDTSNRLLLEHGTIDRQVSVKSITPGIWHYLECRFFIDDSVGTIEVFVNGKKGGWIDYGPADTRNTGIAGEVDQIRFSGWTNAAGGPFYFDDMYFLDELGTAPGNARLGDSIVETLNPSGVGAEAQWTPSAGANQENVDEATPDDDTTFNSSGVVDDDDRFAMDNLVNIPSTVFAVQVNGMFRLENSGARDVRLKAHDGVTEGQSADFAPSFDPAYAYEIAVFEDHPTDANPWSTAEVNAMEAGYRIQS
jgi:hypothetical protein